jgi:hypothetical protein
MNIFIMNMENLFLEKKWDMDNYLTIHMTLFMMEL